jgi:fumarate reductase flavoprotein subunit
MSILPATGVSFAIEVPVAIVGAGAAGMTAALAARDAGADVLMLERDPVAQGSTALSSGLIPAAGTKVQRAKGIADDCDLFATDIQHKARHEADKHLVDLLARESGPTIDWLAEKHGIPFTLVEGFLYPGHSVLRMHGTPRRTGAELMAYLSEAATRAGAELVTQAQVDALYADPDGGIMGLRVRRPDGTTERIGCAALVLACSGFGGNPELVRRYIPEMAARRRGARHGGLSGPRLGGHPAQYPDHLGADDGRWHPGERGGQALLERASGLLGAVGRRAGPARPGRLQRLRPPPS